MMSDLNINQFSQETLPGTLDTATNPNPSVVSCRLNPDSTTDNFVAGQGVRLVDRGANDGAGPPIVDVLSANTDVPFGVIVYDIKQGTIAKGGIVSVALKGAVVRMRAAAALNRAAKVSLDIANSKEVKAVASDAQFGFLLDKSTAADDLVRVLVTTEGA